MTNGSRREPSASSSTVGRSSASSRTVSVDAARGSPTATTWRPRASADRTSSTGVCSIASSTTRSTVRVAGTRCGTSVGVATSTGRSRRSTAGCCSAVSRRLTSRPSSSSVKRASASSRCSRIAVPRWSRTAARTGAARDATCARSSSRNRRERVEARAVLPGERLVLSEDLLEHRAPPGELQLGADLVGLDAARCEVGEQLAEAEVGEPVLDRGPRRERVERGGVLGERVEAGGERVERHVEQASACGRAREHRLELLDVDADGLVRVLDGRQPLGQHGPAAAGHCSCQTARCACTSTSAACRSGTRTPGRTMSRA